MTLLYDQKNLRPLSQKELDEAVKKHNMFINARVGGARAVLTYRNLSHLLLRGAKLPGADFSGSLLYDCDLRGANLDGTIFFTTNLQKSDFSNASIIRGDFRGSNLKGANFSGADLTSADLREGSIATKDRRGNINLRLQPEAAKQEAERASPRFFIEHVDAAEALFMNAKMSRALLRGANLTHAVLEGADLSMAQLQGAKLKGAVLRGARLDGVDFTEADRESVLTDELQGLTLEDEGLPFDALVQDHHRWIASQGTEGLRLDLSRYDLHPAHREICDFSNRNLVMMKATHAFLYHACFTHARLEASELRHNDLRLAMFNQADLHGADFSYSNLMRANFQLALLGPLKMPSGKNLKTNLSHCNLRFADFTGADLRQVDFTGADLSMADLRGADLEGTQLEKAITEGALLGV